MNRPLSEIIREAVERRDPRLAGAVATALRKRGMSYHQSYAFVNRVAPIRPADWDALLYESDRMGSTSEPTHGPGR